jgi:uncharacterized repeat protein (TIGR03803 family)
MRKTKNVYLLIIALFIGLVGFNLYSQTTLLHVFAGGPDDGKNPWGSLVQDGATLFGMTCNGGDNDLGTIFKINVDGTGFEVIHSFAGRPDDGALPKESLIIDGTYLYGMTMSGGTGGNSMGTIFKIKTDGTDYELLYEFQGSATDGMKPHGSLILNNNILYGMTRSSFYSSKGTIFKINVDGTGFEGIHMFAGEPDDGGYPYGSLILNNDILYGMTSYGGQNNKGTIFKIETDGTDYELLHVFAGGSNDGDLPRGSLILKNNILYGMTYKGGESNLGVIFKIKINGTGFELLHEFSGWPSDGEYPYGSLIQKSTDLYGMTSGGGPYDAGIIFKISNDGSDYKVLHNFQGDASGGAFPFGSLIHSNNILSGMTGHGGALDFGTIFSYELPSITITSPNGGEDWTLNTTQDITWTGSKVTGGLQIGLLQNGTIVALIDKNIDPALGSYSWKVGDCRVGSIVAGTDYKIIINEKDSIVKDKSNGVFTISNPSLTITSPNGGEDWTMGTTQSITWTASGVTEGLYIILMQNGTTIALIDKNVNPALGSYSWTVGNCRIGTVPAGTDYKILIVEKDSKVKDKSSGTFTISE